MTKLEHFALVTAVIGLGADVIALITFFGGFWNTNPQDAINNNAGLPVVAQIIMGLFVVYGWFTISWLLLRRRIIHSKEYTLYGWMVILVSAGVGVLVLPILIGLWLAMAYTNIDTHNEELRENAIVHATQTAQSFQVTVTADPSIQIPLSSQPKTVTELVDSKKGTIWFNYSCGGIFLLFVLYSCISASLFFLMPFAYPDIQYSDTE